MTDMERSQSMLEATQAQDLGADLPPDLATGLVRDDPGEVYKQIRAKHLMFSETSEEKEVRILEEGDSLDKGKLSARQFEARWEEHLADRESVGLGFNAKEALIQYLRKIGPTLSKEVRRDKRFRPDGAGGTAFRAVATWEEAHEVVKEIEATNAGQRALNNSTFATGLPSKAGSGKAKGGKEDRVMAQGSESLAAQGSKDLKMKCGIKDLAAEARTASTCMTKQPSTKLENSS